MQPHLALQSLLASGLTEAPDVVQHCLALCRKADLAGLQQYLPESSSSSTSTTGTEEPAGAAAPWRFAEEEEEQGPLASLAAGGLLDVGARRVLPGHLLRRSQVRACERRWCVGCFSVCFVYQRLLAVTLSQANNACMLPLLLPLPRC